MLKNTLTGLATIGMAGAMMLACGGVALAADMDDELAIRAVWDAYETARMAGDAETWLSLWDEGGIQMPPGMPARGKDVLVVGIPKAFGAIPVSMMDIMPDEIVVAGDWAFSRGNYVVDQVVGGNPVHVDGKFMTILKRQDDGSWKLYRDIFNSNTQ